jgi:hypothetical protein
MKNNLSITNSVDIANEFNNFFANIGKDLDKSIPVVNESFRDYLDSPQSTSFYLNPTTADEIENIISELKLGKACGPFSIPIPILKLIKTSLSGPLQILYNYSFSTGTVPDSFKIANVIPVYKKRFSFICY